MKIKFSINKKIRSIVLGIATVALVAGTMFFAGFNVGAADNEPGSTGDPLVSKSYLDSRLGTLSGTMTKKTITKGNVFAGGEGCQIVIVSGNGNVTGNGLGLINITTGELTVNGTNVAKYNSYIFPDAITSITATSDMVIFTSGNNN